MIGMLLGGLALFLYGMDKMGEGLELLAGNKLQSILEKLTSNKLLGVLVGALVTAIVQSSSATTVMVVGFVNSKLLSLTQAIYIIMGANIGTTVTGLILTLDIDLIAPFLAFIGMVMMLFIKKRKFKYLGTIIFGFGVLFMGMNIMGDAVRPLAENEEFKNLLAVSANPLLGILMGAAFTAVIQSSSATTGILITFANNGIITFESAFYLVLGTNIGTCITSVIASLGASKNAKRVAVSHITFNLIGTIIFTIVALIFPISGLFQELSSEVSSQIAYLHTIFNIVTTIILIPFTGFLASVAKHVIRGSDPRDKDMQLIYLNPAGYHDAVPTIIGIRQELVRMFEMTKKNLNLAVNDLVDHNENLTAEIEYNEEIIDFLNREVTSVSIKALSDNLAKDQYQTLSYYIRIASNIERLGDYSYNIMKLAERLEAKNLAFNDNAKSEIRVITEELDIMFAEVIQSLRTNDFDLQKIKTSAFKIQELAESNRYNSIERMRVDLADPETGLVYDKFYTYVLRLKDHLMNVTNQHESIYS